MKYILDPLFESAFLRLKLNKTKAPIFLTLQYRSAMAIKSMLSNGFFKDPKTIETVMTGLIEGVNLGVEGMGTKTQTYTNSLHEFTPHFANIILGPTVHIPQDIKKGILDCIKKHGRLPNSEDYREMYAPVRASMQTTSEHLFNETGNNLTTIGINSLEAIIKKTGKDPIQYLRDRQFEKCGGSLAEGLPSQRNIEFSIEAILNDPETKQSILL